jgi:hypothetical protein
MWLQRCAKNRRRSGASTLNRIATGREVRVEGRAPAARVNPVRVEAVEAIAEAQVVRWRQGDRGVADLKALRA